MNSVLESFGKIPKDLTFSVLEFQKERRKNTVQENKRNNDLELSQFLKDINTKIKEAE